MNNWNAAAASASGSAFPTTGRTLRLSSSFCAALIARFTISGLETLNDPKLNPLIVIGNLLEGRVFEARNDRELHSAFQQISDELRSQYSLGYSPTNADRDGSYRRVQVRVNERGHKVQARKGYYAPGDE